MKPMHRWQNAILLVAAAASLGTGIAAALAQTPPQAEPRRATDARPSQPRQARPAPRPAASESRSALVIEAGGGQILTLRSAASAVFAADPKVAEVRPASSTSLFVFGIAPGRTTVVATSESGAVVGQWDVTVRSSGFVRAEAESSIRRMIPSAQLRLEQQPGAIVIEGTVANAADAERAVGLVRGLAPETMRVVNRLSVAGSLQVNLRVRVAEISREVTRELGFNWQALNTGLGDFAFGLRTGEAATGLLGALLPGGDPIASNDRFGARYRSGNWDVNAVIDALATDRLITILAEPNLTATSGETASFLAGGEFPVPVAQRDNQVTIEFKQFGVSLAFVPTVLSPERIALRVRPEVSELSEQNGIQIPTLTGSILIRGLAVRRAETSVELGSGQSFAIAGLLQNSNRLTGSGLPGLSEVPVLGALFRSDRFQRNESELVIIVTPYIVRPVSQAAQLQVPTDLWRPPTELERILYFRQRGRPGSASPGSGAPGSGAPGPGTPGAPALGQPPRLPGDAGFIVE